MRVGVIDYGVGNLGSVKRALEELNARPSIVTDPSLLSDNDYIILPGVGNFTDCAKRLQGGGWYDVIREAVYESKRPILGICVGMQLLADFGCEGVHSGDQETRGLGLIPGRIEHLTTFGCSLRLPHVGWNNIILSNECKDSLFDGIPAGTDFYFTHSYGFSASNRTDVVAEVEYGSTFTAAVRHNNIYGTQFHPEKSSRAGFRLLRNFLRTAKC